jgi:GNAT superfamily N-acetyltransferase
MEIRDLQRGEIEEVRQLLIANGWAARVSDAGVFSRLVEASDRNCVAIVSGKVVGYVRAITDRISNGYLSMLVVDAAHRRQGIGTALIEHVTGENPSVTWVLRAARPGADRFFESLGFIPSKVAMERNRTRQEL